MFLIELLLELGAGAGTDSGAGTGATVVCALSYCSEADDTDAYHIFISYRVKSEAALAKQLYHCYYQSAMALRTSRSIHIYDLA